MALRINDAHPVYLFIRNTEKPFVGCPFRLEPAGRAKAEPDRVQADGRAVAVAFRETA